MLTAEADLSERVYRGWDGIGFRHPGGSRLFGWYLGTALTALEKRIAAAAIG